MIISDKRFPSGKNSRKEIFRKEIIKIKEGVSWIYDTPSFFCIQTDLTLRPLGLAVIYLLAVS